MTPNLRDAISRTQTLPGWCDEKKAQYLAELVLENRPDIVVECGVFGGRSLVPLAMACKEIGHGICYGIDPWERDAVLEGEHAQPDVDWWSRVDLETVFFEFVDFCLRWRICYECRWLRTRSEIAVRMFDDETVGIAHIDGNHSELVSCRDLALWAPKVVKGGLIIWDDLDWATNLQAYKTLKSSMETVFDNGKWGVFRKG